MRKIVAVLAATLLLLPYLKSQNVGIGNTTPQAQLAVGSNSQFRVDNNGNLVRINNLIYSFPAAQGANQYLKNDGSGNLTWAPVARAVIRIFSVAPNAGFSAWLIDNAADYASGSNADPNIVLVRGLTYQFSINASGHPFVISASPGGVPYTVGITNNGISSGTITFTIPMDAPASLFYYCSVHPAMNGTITVL